MEEGQAAINRMVDASRIAKDEILTIMPEDDDLAGFANMMRAQITADFGGVFDMMLLLLPDALLLAIAIDGASYIKAALDDE